MASSIQETLFWGFAAIDEDSMAEAAAAVQSLEDARWTLMASRVEWSGAAAHQAEEALNELGCRLVELRESAEELARLLELRASAVETAKAELW